MTDLELQEEYGMTLEQLIKAQKKALKTSGKAGEAMIERLESIEANPSQRWRLKAILEACDELATLVGQYDRSMRLSTSSGDGFANSYETWVWRVLLNHIAHRCYWKSDFINVTRMIFGGSILDKLPQKRFDEVWASRSKIILERDPETAKAVGVK